MALMVVITLLGSCCYAGKLMDDMVRILYSPAPFNHYWIIRINPVGGFRIKSNTQGLKQRVIGVVKYIRSIYKKLFFNGCRTAVIELKPYGINTD